MFSTLSKSQYKVVSRGALPTTVRPRIEPSIEAVLNMDIQTTKDKRFGRKVTTAKARIG